MTGEVVPRRIDQGALLGGVVLIAFGVLFLLDEFHVADFSDVIRRHWPLIVIASGAGKLSQRESFWGGLWVVAVGIWLQLVTLHVFGLSYRNSWPLILMVLGAGIILKTLVESARERKEHHEP